MSVSLLDLFPTPTYLAQPVLGLDISDNSIKFVEFLRKKGGFELGRFGERVLPEGTLENGKIQKPEEVKQVLFKLHEELRLRTAFVSVMEEQGYLLRLRVPVKTESEIHEAIELQLEEHIPLPPTEIIFDYDIFSRPHDGAEYYDVSVSAFPREVAESYYDVIAGGGFEPLALEIESHALGRALMPQGDLGTAMLVDLGAHRTGVAIVSDGVVAFSSTVPVGGENFTHVLEKELNLSHEKAEELKREKGISRGSDSKNLFSFFVPLLSVFRDEISKQYAYWHSHAYESGVERKKIERIILSGRGANMRGIADYLSSSLGVPVAIGNPWSNSVSFLRTVPAMPAQDSLGFTVAIGLTQRAFNENGALVLHI